MKKISSSAKIVGILLVLAILLSGCRAGTSSTTVPGRQSSLYTTTPKPDPSNTADIVLGIVADPNASVNPIYCTTRDVMNINTLVFESVVELDDSMKPVPLLADRWEVSEENIWTFTLRSGIVFHDGNPLTAYDVVATYNTIVAAGEAYPWYSRVADIKGMIALNDLQVSVKADSDAYALLYAMTFPVVSRSYVDAAMPMGTGPYWYIQYTTDTALRLEANPLWWKQTTNVHSVQAVFFSETVDALSALQTGGINTLATRSTTAALARNLKGRVSLDYPTTTYECIIPNLSDPILSDKTVRQALMYAIDRSTLAENSYLGMVQQTEVPVVPGSWLYEMQAAAYNYSPERALQLLNDSGWVDSNGDFYLDKYVNGTLTTLELEIITYDEPSAPTRSNAAAAIVEQLNLLGIKATYKTLDPDSKEWTQETIKKALKNKYFQLALIGVNLSTKPDLKPLLSSNGKLNYSGYANEAMDSYLNEAMAAKDEVSMRTAMASVQLHIINELPILGLFFRSGTVISTLDVSGLSGIREGNVLRGIEFITPQ